jgi:hypothetical protein
MNMQPDLKLAAQRARVLLQDAFLAWITILMLLSAHWSAILVHLIQALLETQVSQIGKTTLEPLLTAFPNCPPFSGGRQEKSGGRYEKSGNCSSKRAQKSGGRQEMRGKSGANPETWHIRQTGVCRGQSEKEGNSRKKGEAAGKSC